jgi:hypothetical protein
MQNRVLRPEGEMDIARSSGLNTRSWFLRKP